MRSRICGRIPSIAAIQSVPCHYPKIAQAADRRSPVGQLILSAVLGWLGVVGNNEIGFGDVERCDREFDLCLGKKDRQFAEFSGEGFAVPTGIKSNAVLGKRQSPLLQVRQVRDLNDGHVRHGHVDRPPPAEDDPQ